MALEKEQPKSAEDWSEAIKLAQKEFKSFETRGDKVVKRYRAGDADDLPF